MTESGLLLQALQVFYGFESFRPQQRETIEHVLDGGDALILMPTGGGKSLCYQLPSILSDGLTVVVSPLIAFMHDQVTALQRTGISAQYLNSTLSSVEAAEVERQVVDGAVNLLYVAPERVNTSRFRNLMEQRNPSMIAIDEAHCISEWGHEFRPDYRVLRQLTERFVDVPTIACTATATPQVQRDIIDQLDRPRMKTFQTSFMRDNLTLRIVPKNRSVDHLAVRLRLIEDGSAIVYSQSRKSTEQTADSLRKRGIDAEYYHAGIDGQERRRVQERFMSSETPVICATIAFGMGIHKPDIRLVAHLDMPSSIEAYYQEAGRAGRDGQPSECLLFYTKGVWHNQMHFIDRLQDEAERERRIKRLRTMMNFCEQSTCRWSRILHYFGEQPAAAKCGRCDNCLGLPATNLKEPAQSRRAVDPDNPPEPPGRNEPTRRGEPRPLTEEEDRLYEALRQWRLQKARDEAVSAFIIFSNRVMAELARTRPTNTRELLAVAGIGPQKVERYGEEILQVIEQHPSDVVKLLRETLSQHSINAETAPSDIEPPESPGRSEPGPLKRDEERLYEALRQERQRIARDAGLSERTVATNVVLAEIARERPLTTSQLLTFPGIGPSIVARYGDRFLRTISQYPKHSRTNSSGPELSESASVQESSGPGYEDRSDSWIERFNALAEWRTETSERDNSEPSSLLSFTTMRELAESPPSTVEALAAVDGVGPAAANRYADEILQILGVNSPPPQESPLKLPPAPASEPQKSWQVTADLYQDGHTLLAIAERRMLSPGTVASHLTTAIAQRPDIDLTRSLPPVEILQEVHRLLDQDPDASTADLLERLDHKLSHPELRLVLAYLRPPDIAT